MSKLLKAISGAAALLFACLAFLVAAVLDRAPAVPAAPIPDAQDVRSAVQLVQLAQGLMLQAEPVPAEVPQPWLEAAHRLVGYAKDNLAIDGIIDDRGATFRLSKRVMTHGWINIAVRLDETKGGSTPKLSLNIGRFRVADIVTATALNAGFALMRHDGETARSFADIVPHFRTDESSLAATARLPRQVVGTLQAVFSPGPGAGVDIAHVRAYYGDLLAYAVRSGERSYPQLIRHVALGVRDQDDLKAAIIALTMYVDGPRVRRLAGERSATPPCILPPQPAFLQGRDDLPKHWTISAALALFMNQRTARAVGLWKELDDSLPGGDGLAAGSGFSFVDLGADTGGVALGMVARDSAGLESALRALRSGRDEVILPSAILRLPEGVPLTVFQKSYGGLEQPRMRAAEARIGSSLRQSPLYAGSPFIAPR